MSEWIGERMEEIELGSKVKDTITGLVGIATARCLYIHGCDHIGIQPPADQKTGKVPSLVWVDSPQVETLKINRNRKWRRRSIPNAPPLRSGGPGEHPNKGSRAHPEYDDGRVLND